VPATTPMEVGRTEGNLPQPPSMTPGRVWGNGMTPRIVMEIWLAQGISSMLRGGQAKLWSTISLILVYWGKMKTIAWLFLLWLAGGPSRGIAQQLALTFDDLSSHGPLPPGLYAGCCGQKHHPDSV
jgi:hypothetical protein